MFVNAAAIRLLLPIHEETTELQLHVSLGLGGGLDVASSQWMPLVDILAGTEYPVRFERPECLKFGCSDITR